MMIARGFSLIEVLIAVLVLAVGLLGLGAIFPAVIVQQRAATDTIEATRATEFTRVQLFDSGLVDFDDLIADGSIPVTLTGDDNGYGWDTQEGSSLDQTTRFDEKTGMLTLPTDKAERADVRRRRQIPVRARLFPEMFTGSRPRYVWDAVTHRSRVTDNIEVAVFIRRINGGIKVADGWQLSNVLSGLTPSGAVIDPVLPIAMDKDRDLLVRPSGGSNEVYAVPQVRRIQVKNAVSRDNPVSDRITVSGGANEIVDRYLKVKGQKFVDDFGVIRTVKSIDKQRNEIVVTPPFRGGELDAEWIVFTPDIPIRVRVFAIEGGS